MILNSVIYKECIYIHKSVNKYSVAYIVGRGKMYTNVAFYADDVPQICNHEFT